MIPLVAITFATIGKNIFTRGYYVWFNVYLISNL